MNLASWGTYNEILSKQPQEDLDDPNIDYEVRVTEYVNQEGKQVKRTELVKITKTIKKVPKSVLERRKRLKPFGNAATCTPLENSQKTIVSSDPISINMILSKKDESSSSPVKPVRVITCQMCGGNHWTRECNNTTSQPSTEEQYVPPDHHAYVPPNRRPGAATNDDDECKIRITNLPEEATREDIGELVSQVGRTRRVNLVRDRRTGESRGFAFVTFSRPSDVERAIEMLNGHLYDHMVLSVEKARRRD